MKIGKVIKALAAVRGISLASLAESIGKHPSHFSKQISGERAISAEDLEKIGSAIGLKPSQIYEEAEELLRRAEEAEKHHTS